MVDRIVLDIELTYTETFGQPLGANERRETRVKTRAWISLDGQQLAVAPQALRARFNRGAGEERRNRFVVVGDLERPQAFVAHPESSGGESSLAKMAAKIEIHDQFVRVSMVWWACKTLIVHGNPRPLYSSVSRAVARVPPSLESATIDGPAPLRHTPRISGSSNAMACVSPGTSDARTG